MDIRLDVEFFNHPKTVKLERLLTFEGIRSLLKLWLWAAKNRPDGDFSGMDSDDIEIAGQWCGDTGGFSAALIKLAWLDGEPPSARLHNWAYRNGWVADTTNRSDKARLSRMAYTFPELYAAAVAEGMTAITREEYLTRVANFKSATTAGALTTLQRPAGATTLTVVNGPLPSAETGHTNAFNVQTNVNGSLTQAAPAVASHYKTGHTNTFNVQTNVNDALTPAPAPAPAPALRASDLEGLSTELYTELYTRYPELDIFTEIKTALEWKNKKRLHIDNYKGFFIDWLNRKRNERCI